MTQSKGPANRMAPCKVKLVTRSLVSRKAVLKEVPTITLPNGSGVMVRLEAAEGAQLLYVELTPASNCCSCQYTRNAEIKYKFVIIEQKIEITEFSQDDVLSGQAQTSL